MGILDGIVDWLATQVMNLLDLASTSVLGALGCNMDTFKRYFPAASSMYEIFIWTAIGLVLLNLVWQLYRCYGAGFDIDTENPINLVVRSVIFLLLIWYCDDIVNLALQIGGTPYTWILDSSLPGVQFGDFNSVLLIIIGVIANGSVALIALILVVILAWNYLKLLLEAAERYVVLGILVFTAPLAFAMGAARGTNNIFKSWCRMFSGQLLLLIMNAWCLKLFVNMVGEFLANPLSLTVFCTHWASAFHARPARCCLRRYWLFAVLKSAKPLWGWALPKPPLQQPPQKSHPAIPLQAGFPAW